MTPWLTPPQRVEIDGPIALAFLSHWTAWHHVVHWSHGGNTDLENMVLLKSQ
jgi:hypothetical protein